MKVDPFLFMAERLQYGYNSYLHKHDGSYSFFGSCHSEREEKMSIKVVKQKIQDTSQYVILMNPETGVAEKHYARMVVFNFEIPYLSKEENDSLNMRYAVDATNIQSVGKNGRKIVPMTWGQLEAKCQHLVQKNLSFLTQVTRLSNPNRPELSVLPEMTPYMLAVKEANLKAMHAASKNNF